MVIDREIGKRVKKAIKESGIKQNTIAERLNLKKGTMTSYVTGIRHIPEENLKKIAELTNVSVQWLLTGDETDNESKQEKPFYPANLTFPKAIQLTEKQLLEILKLKDSNPFLYKVLESMMERNQQLSDFVDKLQKQNEANKQNN